MDEGYAKRYTLTLYTPHPTGTPLFRGELADLLLFKTTRRKDMRVRVRIYPDCADYMVRASGLRKECL